MSNLNEVDILLLDRVKSEIERISGLKTGDDLSQKDYHFLIYYIEEKTSNRLSLTTIKRIWRNEFHRLPHLSTLDMLSHLAYGIDWLTLKKKFLHEKQTAQAEVESSDGIQVKPEKTLSHGRWAIVVAMVLVLGILGWYVTHPVVSGDLEQVKFSAKATADGKIPNTVVFSYDVKSVAAKKFFIQQSWDVSKKFEVSKNNNKQTDIYYEPGYHYAKLFADDKVIREIPVHVRYPDWFVRLRYSNGEVVHIEEANVCKDNFLSVKKDFFENASSNANGKYGLAYMLSKDFNISADQFQFSALFKMDSVPATDCPITALLLKGDNDYIFLSFGNTGCESNLSVKCGNVTESGKTTDLSALGTDIFNWQTVSITVLQKTMVVSLNGKIVKTLKYTESLGELKELDFLFDGKGEIDEVKINQEGRGALYFDFSSQK